MPIGDYYSLVSGNRLVSLIHKLLGTPDLHTQIKFKPVIKFIKKYLNSFSSSQLKILDLGCGMGIGAFEIEKAIKNKNIDLDYVGVDVSEYAICGAKRVLKEHQNIRRKISFFQEDAGLFLKKNNNLKADIVLLLDIIEHVKNPQDLIAMSDKILLSNGLFVVSVPTPIYPKIFGRKTHIKVGHLVEGYSESQLDGLFLKMNYQKVMREYNTGMPAIISCWLSYNIFSSENKYFNFFKFLFLYPFKFLDFYNGPKVSTSLFAVYKKVSA